MTYNLLFHVSDTYINFFYLNFPFVYISVIAIASRHPKWPTRRRHFFFGLSDLIVPIGLMSPIFSVEDKMRGIRLNEDEEYRVAPKPEGTRGKMEWYFFWSLKRAPWPARPYIPNE